MPVKYWQQITASFYVVGGDARNQLTRNSSIRATVCKEQRSG